MLKDIKECRKKLLPTADTHHDHDLDLLKTHISHAVDLLSDPCLPFEVTDELRDNVGLVRKALFQEKVEVTVEPPKTSKKKHDRTVWMMMKMTFTGRVITMPNLMYCSVLK